ncbi:hypothetical protein ACIP61_01045 [Pseudomonas fulva]|uniref:hypothetical protein n=1 Tax=Pseudomonas fulva TaxID=47880 RepID=UPI0038165920
MQTAMHPAFEQKLAVLAALLERSKSARIEAQAKVRQLAPRYQASAKADHWNVIEIETGAVKGFTFSYRSALRFVDIMEAAADHKLFCRK